MGVDFDSKRIALAVVHEDEVFSYEFIAKEKTAAGRFESLIIWFKLTLAMLEPAVVYLEGLPFIKNREGFISLASVFGGIRAVCVFLGIECKVVAGYEWKRRLGTGSSKADVAAWVAERYPALGLVSQDRMDALCVALYGAQDQG